uniref:Uncharacterized protein n=1 Tax=Hippocampus comes TaxID=109280 RepID=A0A3Q2Y8C1_HIPCM
MPTLRTHSSILPMSVSSSQGLTSRRMEDLAITAGFLDFLAAYSASLCSFIFAASAPSPSSSEPKRSRSSSLLVDCRPAGQIRPARMFSNRPADRSKPRARRSFTRTNTRFPTMQR